MPTQPFARPRILLETRADGSRLLRPVEPLLPSPSSLLHAFRDGSDAHPDRLLLAEREGDGWRRSTWGQARVLVDRLAQGLLSRGLADRPVMLLSGNSQEHLLLTLAAWSVGAPVVPTSVAYSLQSTDHAKLRAMADLAAPGVVVAPDPTIARALQAVGDGRTMLLAHGEVGGAVTLDRLQAEPTAEVDARVAGVRTATVAKVL